MHYLIVWVGIDELGMNKSWIMVDWLVVYWNELVCMINLWLVGETWLWYKLDVIP